MQKVGIKCADNCNGHSAVFCTVSSFVMFVVYELGDHAMEAYSSIGPLAALYAKSNVSLSLTRLVKKR